MNDLIDALPRARPACRISIAIPAKNECATIENALAAFAGQRGLDGSPLDARTFEIIVLANDCDDDTVARVRAFAAPRPHFAIHAVECRLPRDAAHVGSARRLALDIATARQQRLHGDWGVVASTDADSTVDPQWIARTLDEMTRVDVVAGHVEIARVEHEAMEAPLRLLYDRERAYRRLLGDVEARYDPRSFDPPSRHDAFVGASFAMNCGTYVAAGRLPILPRLEDVAFSKALRRIDARVRHPYDVRVETSARVLARVDGGFGSFIEDLRERSTRRETFLVDNGTRSVLRAKARGALRAYWANPASDDALAEAARTYEIASRMLFSLVDTFAPFGETLERVEALPIPFETLTPEPVDAAIATLRDAVSAAMPVAATRINAASGAG